MAGMGLDLGFRHPGAGGAGGKAAAQAMAGEILRLMPSGGEGGFHHQGHRSVAEPDGSQPSGLVSPPRRSRFTAWVLTSGIWY
jgi:hypothetical protein